MCDRTVVSLAHRQIEQAIAVCIDRRQPASGEQRNEDAAFLRDIGESPAAVIAEQEVWNSAQIISVDSTVRDEEVQATVVRQIDKQGSAAGATGAQMFLPVELESASVIAKEDRRLGAGVVKGVDE